MRVCRKLISLGWTCCNRPLLFAGTIGIFSNWEEGRGLDWALDTCRGRCFSRSFTELRLRKTKRQNVADMYDCLLAVLRCKGVDDVCAMLCCMAEVWNIPWFAGIVTRSPSLPMRRDAGLANWAHSRGSGVVGCPGVHVGHLGWAWRGIPGPS